MYYKNAYIKMLVLHIYRFKTKYFFVKHIVAKTLFIETIKTRK